MARLSRDHVFNGVSTQVKWWIDERLKKFRELSHDTMAVNPFMLPLLFALHSHADFDELAEFLLGGHFSVGHATGFGKLLDEKILPKVFGTVKLDKAFRRNAPYSLPVFSEIDHLIPSASGGVDLLSLKASRWTIQLTMAVQMNHSFHELVGLRQARQDVKFNRIVVGVIYGTVQTLTDKFSIVRGICSGAKHDVYDLQSDVTVVAGRGLFALLNGNEPATQDWIMEGVEEAIKSRSLQLKEAAKLLEGYKNSFGQSFARYIDSKTKAIDWQAILRDING